LRHDFFSRQLLLQKIWQIDIEIDLSFLGGLTVSTGITVGASKDAPIGDIEGRNSFETAKISWSEYLSSSQSWKNFVILHGTNLPRCCKNINVEAFPIPKKFLSTPSSPQRGEGRVRELKICFS
jgi:hypothetical protein